MTTFESILTSVGFINNWCVLPGNCLALLKAMPDGFVQTCVTSPPYFGLRDYKLPPQVWDAQEGCDHEWSEHFTPPRGGKNHPDRPSITGSNRHMSELDIRGVGLKSQFCSLCGAWAGHLGLEPSLHMYVKHLVQIFREVRRVLRDDGTFWLNLGDSYNGSGGGHKDHHNNEAGFQGKTDPKKGIRGNNLDDLKPKDLVGIPWRVALALQADGWYLRSDIIWNKPNPMPESVTDRPTKSHEYIFLLSKSQHYFYDSDSIADKLSTSSLKRYEHAVATNEQFDPSRHKNTEGVQSPMEVLTRSAANVLAKGMKNKRSVWTIATQSFEEAHFATFPPRLIEPCILAGSSAKGCCPQCGTSWERAMLGWKQVCTCEAKMPVPSVVLDPFSGSGTTGLVALYRNRRYLGLELNPEYIAMSEKRIGMPLFDEPVATESRQSDRQMTLL